MLAHSAHVVIQARSEADVDTKLIMKRVADAGGAKYTAGMDQVQQNIQAPPPKMERPAPVGSAYVPIGRPDMNALTAGSKMEAPTVVGSSYVPIGRPDLNALRTQAQSERNISLTPSTTSVPPAAPPAASRPVVSRHNNTRRHLQLTVVPLQPPAAVTRPSFNSSASNFSETAKSSYEPPAPVVRRCLCIYHHMLMYCSRNYRARRTRQSKYREPGS